ncbi:MAG: hypothetical protein ACR2NZ_02565 [Rubripirellula sp.]
MRLVTRTRLLAVAVVFAAPMLIDAALAVEVSEAATPILPSPDRQIDIVPTAVPTVPKPSKGCFILGSRSFSIPFTVDATGTQPVEVRLFASDGNDDTWKLIAKKKPSESVKQFQYEAPRDGEFWFATRTIDSQGRAHPSGSIVPQLKVYVDTTKPALVLDADADERGRVNASLVISDATPLKIVRLRYVTDTLNRWQNVDVSKYADGGKLQFTPPSSWKLLSLQFVATDTPGNQTVINQRVRRPRLAEKQSNRYAVAEPNEALEAQSLPYRLNMAEGLNAKTASSPIIKLDRHQRAASPSLVTAHGYTQVNSGTVAGYGNLPHSSDRSAPVASSTPPMLAPAPRVSTRPVHSAPPTQGTWTANVPRTGYSPVAPIRPQPASQPTSRGQAPATNQGYGSLPPYGMTPQFTPPSTANSGRYPVTASPAASRTYAAPAGTAATPQNTTPTTPDPFNQGLNGLFRQPTNNPQPNQVPFGPPSVRNAAPPTVTANASPKLPPPATPMQIGEGFNLNSPQQSTASPSGIGGSPQLAPAQSSASQPKAKPRPRTAAEAMRPISEKSAVESPSEEEIPAPQPEPDPEADRYRARRATPVDPRIAMQRAPVRFSDSERFSLEYELEAVGNQGVEAIELYGSLDHGRTWSLWGQDPDRMSPFDIETKGEGVFGFRIVVVGASGLASPRPLAGETPDIFVVVDRTQPNIRITGAQYGEGDRIGALVIRYECQDGNLLRRPIALSFSDNTQGPWTTIAAGLQNDGDYVWRADPNLPRQLYLRIDGTDQAGNVGSYVLDQPIDTQGLAPRARIRGFQSLSGGQQPSGDGQTASRRPGSFK